MSEEIVEYTVSRLHLEKMLDHYRDTLIVRHPSRFLTPAFMETLQRELNDYQSLNAKRETNPVWRIPVKILGDARTGNIDVTIADNVKLTFVAP